MTDRTKKLFIDCFEMLRDWEHSFILPVCCFDVVDIYIYELNHFSCFVQLIVVAQQTVFLAGSGALHACVWESFTVSLFTTTKSSNHYAQAFIWLLKLPASPEKARRFSPALSLLVWSPDSYRKSFACHVKTFMAQPFSNQRKGTQQGWLSRQWLL